MTGPEKKCSQQKQEAFSECHKPLSQCEDVCALAQVIQGGNWSYSKAIWTWSEQLALGPSSWAVAYLSRWSPDAPSIHSAVVDSLFFLQVVFQDPLLPQCPCQTGWKVSSDYWDLLFLLLKEHVLKLHWAKLSWHKTFFSLLLPFKLFLFACTKLSHFMLRS